MVVLGKKAVAGVDGIGTSDLGRSDDAGDAEIALTEVAGPMQTSSSA
jgi:hypothetical protein